MEKKGVAVVAVGGNSLIKDETHKTVYDQYEAGRESMNHIVEMIEQGWEVVVTHGNGPQVGFILRRSELSAHELHEVPLDYCGADSQGGIGYMFARALDNEFRRARDRKERRSRGDPDRGEPQRSRFQEPHQANRLLPGREDRQRNAPLSMTGWWWKTPGAAGAAWWPRPSRSASSKPSRSAS
jgi:hypothetical protein